MARKRYGENDILRLIREVRMHVQKSILRSMAWAKRRYNLDGGEQVQLFDYLQTL